MSRRHILTAHLVTVLKLSIISHDLHEQLEYTGIVDVRSCLLTCSNEAIIHKDPLGF